MRSTQVITISLLTALALSALFLSRPIPKPENSPHTANGKGLNAILAELKTEEGRMKYTRLYDDLCASCHGPDLKGISERGTPSLLRPIFSSRQSVFVIAEKIFSGSDKMPSFSQTLTRPEIVGLSLWVVSKVVPQASKASQPTQTINWTLSGTLKLGQYAKKNGILFLFAKTNPSMKGPPLIVKKLSLSSRVPFSLSAQDAMMGRPIPEGTTLYVQARIDTDGNPLTKTGEPQTKIKKVTVKGQITNFVLEF